VVKKTEAGGGRSENKVPLSINAGQKNKKCKGKETAYIVIKKGKRIKLAAT